MTASGGWLGLVTRRRHPRLAVLLGVGVAMGLVGVGLLAAGIGSETLGLRLAVIGGISSLAGASGYIAFSAFEHGFD